MSKYEKSNWIDNETVLKAEHMRKIEQGIVDLYDEIENVVIGNVDLSKYATTEYVDEEVKELILKAGRTSYLVFVVLFRIYFPSVE